MRNCRNGWPTRSGRSPSRRPICRTAALAVSASGAPAPPDNYEASLAAQAGADAARRSRMGRADAALRHARMLREDGSLELYESEAEFQASLPGWAAREPLRHRLPASRAARARRTISRACRHASCAAPSRRAGRRSATRRISARRSGATRKQRAPRSCSGDVGLVAAVEADSIAIQLKHGRTIMARQGWSIAAGAWSHLLAQQFGDRFRSRPSAATTRRCRRPPST